MPSGKTCAQPSPASGRGLVFFLWEDRGEPWRDHEYLLKSYGGGSARFPAERVEKWRPARYTLQRSRRFKPLAVPGRGPPGIAIDRAGAEEQSQ